MLVINGFRHFPFLSNNMRREETEGKKDSQSFALLGRHWLLQIGGWGQVGSSYVAAFLVECT